MPSAALLVIGNEILSGKVVDTNSPFLAQELRGLGVDLERILTIPDDIELIAREARAMSEAYDFVFTSGGIGPTHDDLTMDGIARAFGRPIVLSESILTRIERATGQPPNESMRKMGLIPDGATLVDAGDLWFPIVVVENVHIFPGIPELFRKKFHSIRERFRGIPFQLKKVYVTRFESEIAEHLNSLLEDFPELLLGSYPRIGETEYKVMLTLESRDAEYLERSLQSLLARLPEEGIHRIE
jgi:molybdenum cofactor synthesis domain-containing protein